VKQSRVLMFNDHRQAAQIHICCLFELICGSSGIVSKDAY